MSSGKVGGVWNAAFCDDSTKQPGAGVGIATRGDHIQTIQTTIHTDDFREAYECGRLSKHIVDLGWEEHVMVYCIYGVSGGTPEARKITDHLVATANSEMQRGPIWTQNPCWRY